MDIGSPLNSFIKKSVQDIEAGTPKEYQLQGPIQFELSVVNTSKVGGKIDLKVVNACGGIETGTIQKLRFSIQNKHAEKRTITGLKKIIKSLLEAEQENNRKIKKRK